MIFCNLLQAQDNKDRIFQKFKGDISIGYARYPSDAEIKNGFLVAIEPKFLILDQLAVGVRYELVIQGKDLTTTNSDGDFKLRMMQSFIGASEFYFTKEYRVRPFAGAGAGMYLVYDSDNLYTNQNENVFGNRVARFGVMLRAGVELKRVRFGFEYNIVPNTVYYNYNESMNRLSKNSYFSVKAAFAFGGAPKDRT